MPGEVVGVELFSTPAEADGDATLEPGDHVRFLEDRSVRLAADGEVLTVRFEITPDEPGKRQYFLKVIPPRQDVRPPRHQKSARVTVVERSRPRAADRRRTHAGIPVSAQSAVS